jgi:hypothetical protein
MQGLLDKSGCNLVARDEHSLRQTCLFWRKKDGSWMSDSAGYYGVTDDNIEFSCNVRELTKLSSRRNEAYSVCRECAIRLGLEW